MNISKIPTITVEALKKLRDINPALYLIDVRENHEWQAMHIPGAWHIPQDEILDRIGQIVTDRSCALFLHCHSGVRSAHAAQSLIASGYENVYSVEGGIAAWEMHDYPLEPQ